ncbi:hypothetical protein SHIRM173S_08826 [Streptomyces hirsutus]
MRCSIEPAASAASPPRSGRSTTNAATGIQLGKLRAQHRQGVGVPVRGGEERAIERRRTLPRRRPPPGVHEVLMTAC